MPPPPRSILLALAVLHDAATRSRKQPLAPSMELRSVVSLLCRIAGGPREPYRDYLTALGYIGTNGNDARYLRSCQLEDALAGITRSLGLQPGSGELHQAISALIPKDGDAVNRAMAQVVKDHVYTREIVATKGHPYSAPGRAIMARNIAEGRGPDGEG